MSEIHFAQIREDGRLERRLTAQHRPTRIVCIASGGCTALSLLSDAEWVYAVDANPGQCALVELRRAAIRQLSREQYLAFISERPSTDRVVTFQRLASDLPEDARAYWQAHLEVIAAGVNQCGSTERFYRFVGQNLRTSVIGNEVWEELFAAPTIEAQRELFQRHFTSEAWHLALRLLLSRTTHVEFFPAEWFASAREHDFGAFFASQFEKEVTTKPIADNYFLSQFLFGRYRDGYLEGTPYYLSEEGYPRTKRYLDRLVIVPAALQTFLPTVSEIGAFFLSNVYDWADAESRKTIAEAVARAAAPGAVVLSRNMLGEFTPSQELAGRLVVDEQASTELHQLERSMLYRQVEVGVFS